MNRGIKKHADPLAGRRFHITLMTRISIAHLRADAQHVEFVSRALTADDLYITTTPNGVALVLTVDDDRLDSTGAWNEAEAVVRYMLGCLNVFSNSIGPIEVIAPVSAVRSDGSAETIGATLDVSLRITSKEGRERLLEALSAPPDTLASRLIRLARERHDVARALRILHDRDPSWADIYLLMEIVELSLRGSRPHRGKDWVAIRAQQWLPSATTLALKRNAGYHRHAKQFDAPNPLMRLDDAQRHCKVVIRRWLETLAAV